MENENVKLSNEAIKVSTEENKFQYKFNETIRNIELEKYDSGDLDDEDTGDGYEIIDGVKIYDDDDEK